jgi:UrcA family protein
MKTASSTTNLIACVTIVGAITVGFASGPAFAQSGRDETAFEFKFAYKPSELQSAPAAEKLLVRLENEVRDHCAITTGRVTMDQHLLTRKCVDRTVQETIAKFASATVAQAYDTRTSG